MIKPYTEYYDFAYSGVCGDGSVLPVVVFTKDKEVPVDTVKKVKGLIKVYDHKGKPTTKTTEIWWDCVRDYFGEGGLLILDKGGEFCNQTFKDTLERDGVAVMFLPPNESSFLDVCDNSFHSVMKRDWWNRGANSHTEALNGVMKAYRSPREEGIKRMWERTRMLGDKKPTKYSMEQLVAGGRVPTGRYRQLHETLYEEFLAFQEKSTLCRAMTI